MIIVTIVKDDPEGLARTLKSIMREVAAGLPLNVWLIKTTGAADTSLSGLAELPSFSRVIQREDTGIYDAMNQAISAISDSDPRDWVCLLNAKDQFNEGFAQWFNHLITQTATDVDIVIGRAVTEGGTVIEPIASIIGQGGLNFCHQAALFRREVLTRFPFPTQFRIAGDYAQFLCLGACKRSITDATMVVYDNTGVSERSLYATRRDNLKAGYHHRGALEFLCIMRMLIVRAVRKLTA